jgi:endonuclease/exonuclease/phosphatase family metal-dependent hydrolase
VSDPFDTPSLVTRVVDDLHDPVLPAPGADHRRAVADAGCFDVVEAGGPPTEAVDRPLRVVAANLERGRRLDDWAQLLTSTAADVVLISEADGGMARSGNRYVARELADRLGMSFAFAVEFLELGLGSPAERAALPAGARNEFGAHGGAVLSRVGLERPAAVRFEFDGGWYDVDGPEPRVGGRCAVLATVGGIVVVAPHLESHGGPRGRARQVADLLDLVERYAEGRPVLVGGDLNTHTLDLAGEEARDGQDATADGHGDDLSDERFLQPFAWEPLFAEAAARGYRWEGANADEPTYRTEDRGGPVRGKLNLDWFLTRGLVASDPEVIPVLGGDGTALSDHELIAVTVEPG